jgi:hypothetical protein
MKMFENGVLKRTFTPMSEKVKGGWRILAMMWSRIKAKQNDMAKEYVTHEKYAQNFGSRILRKTSHLEEVRMCRREYNNRINLKMIVYQITDCFQLIKNRTQ